MIIVNGSEYQSQQIIFDEGLQFGRGVFETIRVGDEPQFLRQHLDRLRLGMTFLSIGREICEEDITSLIKTFEIKNCILKIIATAQNLVLTTRENPYSEATYQQGYKLKVSAIRRNPSSPSVAIKSISYIDNILAREDANKHGYDDALLLNTEGKVAECSAFNIFWVKAGKLYTPDVACGILPGIMRQHVLSLHDVCEGSFSLDDLYGADEVFITNSVAGTMKVTVVDDHIFTRDT